MVANLGRDILKIKELLKQIILIMSDVIVFGLVALLERYQISDT